MSKLEGRSGLRRRIGAVFWRLKPSQLRRARIVRRRLLVAWNTYLRRGFDRRVDFVVAGAMRSGTSALYNYMRQHPEICFSERKEVRFFDREPFSPGADYRAYHAWFNPRAGQSLLAEATPYYISNLEAPRRLHDYNSAMKIVVILRNPIDRAYSHWNKHVQQHRDQRSFAEVIDAYVEGGSKVEDYFRLGFYAGQLENLWRYFPREQTLLLRNEELLRQPDATLDRLFAFVGVAPFRCRPLRGGFRPYAAPMNNAERQRMHTIYDDESRALAQLTGWDCDAWLEAGATHASPSTSSA